MAEEKFSFKEFEDVRLKATYDIGIGNRKILKGETIAKFDKIMISGLSEIVTRVTANGGFDNRPHVFWETTKEINIYFSQGVFSKTQFALLTGAHLVTLENETPISVTKTEILESDQNNRIELKYSPNDISSVFIYQEETGEKITNFTLEDNIITIDAPYTTVIIDYTFDYSGSAQSYKIGQRLLNGFLELEGKTKAKDDKTGTISTGIIRVPKLKLMSELSIRLGAQANPVVGNFSAVGVPVGSRGDTYVSDFCFLGDDIDSDF